MAGSMSDDGSPGRPDLKGSPSNPGRDPKKMRMTEDEKNSVGYMAYKDALVIIAVSWLLVLFFYFSLRHYNV